MAEKTDTSQGTQQEQTENTPQKRRRLWLVILLAVPLLICLAASLWAYLQYSSKGSVAVPLPEAVNEVFDIQQGDRLGPLRFTSVDEAKNELDRELHRVWPGVASSFGPESVTPTSASRSKIKDDDPAAFMGGQPLSGSGVDSRGPELTTSLAPLEVQADQNLAAALTMQPPALPEQAGSRAKILQGADPVVTPAFISDFARYLALNYYPKGSNSRSRKQGYSAATLGSVNLHYASDLQGLGNNSRTRQRDSHKERAQVLRYAYMPSMITALSRLYSDRLVLQMQEVAAKPSGKKKPMSASEQIEMFEYYANYAENLGKAAAAYASASDMAGRLKKLSVADSILDNATFVRHEAEHNLLMAQDSFSTATESVEEAKAKLEKAQQEYKNALSQQHVVKVGISGAMGRHLDTESSVYLARWLARRGSNTEAAKSIYEAASFTASVMREKATEIKNNDL